MDYLGDPRSRSPLSFRTSKTFFAAVALLARGQVADSSPTPPSCCQFDICVYIYIYIYIHIYTYIHIYIYIYI